jgi:glycosyltransferase involved in cell wall biosynthesis
LATDVPKKLFALVEGLDHVCFRYRLKAFEPYLNSSGWQMEVHPFPRGLTGTIKVFLKIRNANLVFLQRKLPGYFHRRFLFQNGQRLVFDFDDAVFRHDSFAQKMSRRKGKRFQAILNASDAIIAGNEYLANRAQHVSGPDQVTMIPTCIETEAFDKKQAHGSPISPDAPVVLVWIGSSSTLPLLAGQEDIINRIGRKLSPVRLKVICDSFPAFQHMPVHPVPWSAETEMRELVSSHVGISWLPEDEWGKGKCGLKVLQYMAAGLPVIANPFGVHLEMIEHGKNGFLPETPKAWIRAVKTLRDNPALAKRMGMLGRRIVHERYSVTRWAPVLTATLNGPRKTVEDVDNPF